MNMEALPAEAIVFLFAVAIAAGFIDTLAGGGGLITIPALILSGAPPLLALGTNKLQGSVGTATATYHMLRSGRVKWEKARWLMLSAFLASAAGSIAIQFLDTRALRFAIPVALVAIAVYFLVSPRPSAVDAAPRLSPRTYGLVAVPAIGCYDGLFGPGTGSFFALSGVALRGQGLIDATATAKTLNFATNLGALLVFLALGQALWLIGGVMMCGQLIGATLGSRCLLRIPASYLRWMVVIMCLAMLARYGRGEGWW